MVTEGGLEVRSDSDQVTVEGYASTFGQPYDMGWYEETVAQGAFTRTLKSQPDVRFLINHDGLPLARTTSGTLDLSEDTTGLHIRSVLQASDPDVARIVPKMKRGDLDQMSFAFGIVKGGDSWSDDMKKRTLNELSLAGGDVSVVTYPANPNAGIALRMRQLATEDPDRMRTVYSDLVNGRTELRASTASRMAAAFETLFSGVEIDDFLADPLELFADEERQEVQHIVDEVAPGVPVADIRSLITRKRAKQRI